MCNFSLNSNKLVCFPGHIFSAWQCLKIRSIGERDIYGRKPKSCLGRVFNFKLGSLTENTINPLNANGHF